MENFFIDTDDPLFSILLFVALLLVVAVVNYSLETIKHKQKRKSLLRFLQRFDAKNCAIDFGSMEYDPSLIQPLSLLAKSFENSGEYEKAIDLYLFLIKNIDDRAQQDTFLELLGKTYLHAGFLVKSRDIFLQIVKQSPRNKEVLHYLFIVYDQLQDFKRAKEVIEPLQLLGEDVVHIKNYLDFKLTGDAKAMLQKDANLTRMALSQLFESDPKKAWELYEPYMFDDIVDILWYQSRSGIDFAKVKEDKNLKALYYAKGYIKETVKSKDFNLSLLVAAKKEGLSAGLTFSYMCKQCKNSFPLSFERCPSCLSINSAKVITKVVHTEKIKQDSLS